MNSGANIDDYYSQVAQPEKKPGEDKGIWMKIKIKAKKPADGFQDSRGQESAIPPSPVVQNEIISPSNTYVVPKKTAFVPAISFEAAPKIQARPITPVQPVKNPTNNFVPRDKKYVVNNGNKPYTPRNTSNQQGVGDTTKKPVVPGTQSAPAFQYDPRTSYKPKKPMTPRISFEPAPKMHVTERTNTQVGQKPVSTHVWGTQTHSWANKLQAYAKTHQNAPKRGRNTPPAKKWDGTPTSFEKPKKWIRQNHATEDDSAFRRGKKIAHSRQDRESSSKQILVDKTGQEVFIPELVTVKEFSEKIGVPLPKVVGELMKNGMMATLNSKIDFDTCYIIGEVFNIVIVREISDTASVSDVMTGNIEALLKNDDPEKLVFRAPIVSIMGHVDHGKTSILDKIRSSEIAAGEAGGITQKIGAYQVEKNGKKITFLDTPGHEAFSIMRSRGARLTDLAIIVIAADEGMKPQTIESINHAKEADVPMLIAVNKMDKPGANLDLIRGQLAEQGLQPEEWGGTTVMVPVSAHTGLGIDQLLEMVILLSDMMDLKAHPSRPAVGTVIESHLDQKMGPLSTVLINSGTLKKGDTIVCAGAYGRVRAIRDFKGKNVDIAGPSTPVQIVGLSAVVDGGDVLQVTQDAVTSASKAQEYLLAKNSKSIHNFESASLNMLLTRIKTGSLKQLKVVLKCDSNGSLEALKTSLSKLSTEETNVTFIHAGVGEVNDSDVLMAGTSQALLIAYNVTANIHAKRTLANSKIEYIEKKVIYHIIEKVEQIITGMIDLKHEEVELGIAVIKAIFYTSKEKMIVGLGVKEGKIENKSKIRVVRNGEKVGTGEVANLKSGPSDVHEIEAGEDCGISFKGDFAIQEGDIFELYKMVARK